MSSKRHWWLQQANANDWAMIFEDLEHHINRLQCTLDLDDVREVLRASSPSHHHRTAKHGMEGEGGTYPVTS